MRKSWLTLPNNSHAPPLARSRKISVISEKDREEFEDKVWNRYFISQVQENSSPNGMALVCNPAMMDKAALCRRLGNGDYEDDYVSAMWFGYRIAKGDVP